MNSGINLKSKAFFVFLAPQESWSLAVVTEDTVAETSPSLASASHKQHSVGGLEKSVDDVLTLLD